MMTSYRIAYGLACLVAGCSFSGASGVGGVGGADAERSSDAPPIDEEMIVLGEGPWTFDTDTGTLTSPSSETSMPPSTIDSGIRVIQTDRFVLGAGAILRAHGTLALKIDATTSIDLEAGSMIDVASYWDGDAMQYSLGAGISPGVMGFGGSGNTCGGRAAGAGVQCTHGGSGGGGGGLGANGGVGGEGGRRVDNSGHDCGRLPQFGGIQGGTAGIAAEATDALRAGCGGGPGAEGNASDKNGAGGPGGGAVQLVAGASIEIASATIRAGGAGGRPGIGGRSGAGGGGSGGTIHLTAPMMTFESATIIANGGGGGGGSDSMPGKPGEDALLATMANGGEGDAKGGTGGLGGFGMAPSGLQPAFAERGGGGGGGGAGRIRIEGANPQGSGNTISPAAIMD